MVQNKALLELFQTVHLITYESQFSFAILNLESVERKGKKLQKFEYLENEKSFSDEISIFHSF